MSLKFLLKSSIVNIPKVGEDDSVAPNIRMQLSEPMLALFTDTFISHSLSMSWNI